MKKEKEAICTTVTHSRKGKVINIKNTTGTINIVGQRFTGKKSKNADLVEIEVTGTATTHDSIMIKGSKGRVQITGQEMLTPPPL